MQYEFNWQDFCGIGYDLPFSECSEHSNTPVN